MARHFKRLKNRLSIPGMGSVLLGLSLWIQQGGLKIPNPIPPFYWLGVGLGVLGICLIIVGFIINPATPKPSLFVRSSGSSWTRNPQAQYFWYEVTISNPSPKITLGIQRIILTWENTKDEPRQMNVLVPIIGDINIREVGREPKIKTGEIDSAFNLQPNEVKSGLLLFEGEDNKLLAVGDFRAVIIVITDSQGNKYKQPAKVQDILG